MNQLYDLGYQAIKDPQLLLATACKLSAFVLDVRLNPRSRDPRWNRRYLERLFSAAVYIHVPALGNLNYRDWNAPVAIQGFEAGLTVIRYHLAAHSVILMCACSDRQTCHRLVIAERVHAEIGVQTIPLNLAACKRVLNGEVPGAQLELF
jgi:uncharacterized protein (DUF488 family)